MFWDAAALNEGRLLAVGSTNYTQNPSGPSVSDTRDPLALVLDASGNVEKRIVLLAGPADRRNEARRRPSAMAVEWQSPACTMRQALMRQCSRTHFLSCDRWSVVVGVPAEPPHPLDRAEDLLEAHDVGGLAVAGVAERRANECAGGGALVVVHGLERVAPARSRGT